MQHRANRQRALFRPSPAKADPGLSERGPRRAVDVACHVVCGNSRVEAVLDTVSHCGFGFRCATTFMVGTVVVLEVPGIGPCPGRIRWSFCGRAGGAFHHALDEAQLARL